MDVQAPVPRGMATVEAETLVAGMVVVGETDMLLLGIGVVEEMLAGMVEMEVLGALKVAILVELLETSPPPPP